MSRENENNIASEFIELLKDFVELKAYYYKLSLAEKISLLAGRIVLILFLAIFSLALLLLFIFLIYTLLMSWIGISWVVVLIELGLVILLMAMLWVFKNQLVINPVSSMIINVLFNQHDNEDEDDEDEE